MQGTWAGNMITQAVADTLNLKIYIGESDENFMEITLVEPANASQSKLKVRIYRT